MIRITLGEDCTFAHDIGLVPDSQRFTHIVIGNQYADTAFRQVTDHRLDIDD